MSYSIDALSDDCYPGACRRKGTPHPPRRRLRCHRQPAHRRVACLGRLHAHLISSRHLEKPHKVSAAPVWVRLFLSGCRKMRILPIDLWCCFRAGAHGPMPRAAGLSRIRSRPGAGSWCDTGQYRRLCKYPRLGFHGHQRQPRRSATWAAVRLSVFSAYR